MKKDKKAVQTADTDMEELMAKDYQQEEDEDVKEKHKITKIIIAVVLVILIFFILLLMWWIRDKAGEKFYDPNGKDAVAAAAEENDEIIAPDGCLLDLSGEYVTVVVPLAYYEDNQPANELTEEQKASGYAKIEKIGGNAVYTIKTSYYVSILKGLYEGHSDEYQEEKFLKENHVFRFAQYQYMQKFTVTIGETQFFSPNDYYKLLEHNYYQAAIYQCYLGIAPADINVEFQFKYEGAQIPFVTYKFPELLGKSLASVPVSTDELTKPHSSEKFTRYSADTATVK